jgi:hypothetical protein
MACPSGQADVFLYALALVATGIAVANVLAALAGLSLKIFEGVFHERTDSDTEPEQETDAAADEGTGRLPDDPAA